MARRLLRTVAMPGDIRPMFAELSTVEQTPLVAAG
jgi:hypothetical protein